MGGPLSICGTPGASALARTPSSRQQAPLTGYLAMPTEQLGVPGDFVSGEITPEGDIYTGWAEYQPFYGTDLRAWNQPTRTLPMSSVPLYDDSLSDGGVSYTQQVFTVHVDGQPVVYMTLSARNSTRQPRQARVALQLEYTRGNYITGFNGIPTSPYRYERSTTENGDGYSGQLSEPFDPAWVYSMQGRDVVRDGLLLARGPQARAWMLPTPASTALQAPHDKALYTRRLAPGKSVAWTWQIPLQPQAQSTVADSTLDAVSLDAARAQLLALWRSQEAGMTQISVPEARVNQVYEANVAQILQSRYLSPSGWVQTVNRLQYESYWIRDSAAETVALDDVGLHAAAAQNLAYLSDWQQPDGLYISRPGQQDGVGQALWELAEHAELTQSPAYADSQIPNVTAAVDWIAQVSAADSMGLLPPSTVADDEFVVGGHITGDNLWAAVGLRSAIELAVLSGREDLVGAWQAVDNRFEAALDQAVDRDAARAGHITPALDVSKGYDWGNYNASYPLPIISPNSPQVLATVAYALSQSREGIATYAGVLLHDYLGFPIFETELDGGNAAGALKGFYAELAHTTAPGYGWEDAPWGSRISQLNLAPHGTFAAQFVTMLRNMLVRDDANAVVLLSGVSPAWMHPGQSIKVSDAPTHHGVISFKLTTTTRGARLSWSSSIPAGTEIYWQLPYWVHQARTQTGRLVSDALRLAPSGSVTLRFAARLPRRSAALAVAALDSSYRRAGLRAPIVPAAS